MRPIEKLLVRVLIASLLYWGFALAFILCKDVPFAVGCILKVLPLAVLITVIIIRRKSICHKSTTVLWTVVPALLFSMAGDIAGQFKTEAGMAPLLWQMGFFAVALILYTLYFKHYPKHEHINLMFIFRIVIVILLALFLTSIAFRFVTNIKDYVLLIAGSAYLCLLFIMAYYAIVQRRSSGEIMYTIGAIFFVISDSLIAINILGGKIPATGTLIMSTYYMAQYLLNLPNIIKRAHRHHLRSHGMKRSRIFENIGLNSY